MALSNGVVNEGGVSAAPTVPGIGAVPDEAALGEPLAVFAEGR